MAVLQMQRICICALKKERKQILESLQRLGVIEIEDKLKEDSIFHKRDVQTAKNLLDKNTITAREALSILNTYAPEKKGSLDMLRGREEVDSDLYDKFSMKHHETLDIANRIVKLSKEIAEQKAEILKLNTQIEMLTPWMEFDVPLNYSGTKSTKGFIGSLPDAWTLEMVYEQLADTIPVNVDIISSNRDQTNIFVICLKEKEELVLERLRAAGFSLPTMLSEKSPSEQKSILEDKITEAEINIVAAEDEIRSYDTNRKDLKFLEDYDTMRIEKYDVLGHLLQSNRVFVMTGYIAQKDVDMVEKTLTDRFELAIEIEEPSEKDDVPVLLHNNSFSAPLEGTVAAFSLPGKGEVDPTVVMSLFYYLLFGLMLSDAAYGAIMVITCGLCLLKFRHTMEQGLKNMMKLFFFCGVSTTFWGILFGSYFGDIVDVVSSTFFGKMVTVQPVWFFPVKEPMRMLVFAMLLGIIHLYAGLAMKSYLCIKHKDFKTLIYDVVLWYLLLTSSIVALLSMDVFVNTLGLNFKLSGTTGNMAGIVALIAAIGITLTNGRESKNPFKRFLKGLYALYGITGYLSDVLSYSRLLALGLATGVICTVINKMASMAAGGPLGVIIFILIFLVGHALNIGINALGAYVHTNRLQYVEFFGKFYEGGGRMFQPFGVNTKYYRFKEKMKNEN